MKQAARCRGAQAAARRWFNVPLAAPARLREFRPDAREQPNALGRRRCFKVWNASHLSRGPDGGCSQNDLKSTGGAGLFYCFAVK